jgi:hypothetical protein
VANLESQLGVSGIQCILFDCDSDAIAKQPEQE